MKRLLPAMGTLALAICATTMAAAQTASAGTDPFLWLEQLEGPRALRWVKAENARTLRVLQKDPRFAGFFAQAFEIGAAKDRIPIPTVVGGRIYNFWQDQEHVRGIWRSTSMADYASAEPAWTTVLDLDALAAAEKENWIWQGADCAIRPAAAGASSHYPKVGRMPRRSASSTSRRGSSCRTASRCRGASRTWPGPVTTPCS